MFFLFTSIFSYPLSALSDLTGSVVKKSTLAWVRVNPSSTVISIVKKTSHWLGPPFYIPS